MNKKTLSLMASSLVLVGATVATMPASAASSAQSQFTYWYPWGGDSQKWDLWRIGLFEKKYPNTKINAVYVPTDSGLSNGKLLAAIAGRNPPDLVITDNYQAAYSLAQQGALEPLDQYLQQNHVNTNALLPGIKPLMKYNGQTYLYPQDTNVDLLYYNVKLFKAAGLNPNDPPKTIAQLDADAKKLTKISASGKIERMGFIPWLDDGASAWLWGWVWGANFYDPATKKIDIANSHMVNMFQWMDTYAKTYNPTKLKSFSSGFGGAFSPNHPFFTGQVAMTVDGNWFTEALKQYAPNIDYRVVPIPVPPGGRANATTFGTNVWMIPKGAKDPADAVKFMLFGSGGSILASDINVWRSVAVNQADKKGIKWFNSKGKVTDPVYQAVMTVAESRNSGSPALTSVAPEMSNDLLSIEDQVLYKNAQPGPLLKQLQAKLQGEIH